MRLSKLLLASALAAGGVALATDTPHDAGNAIGCLSCHIIHNAQGPALTTDPSNPNLCQSCHTLRTGFGFPWVNGDQAVPDAAGHSHRWDAPAANSTFGASAPTTAAMSSRVPGGKLMCSTCHDQHAAAATQGGPQHLSVTAGAALVRSAGTGTGTVVVNAPAAAAAPKAYLLKIVQGGAAGTATFQVSNDNGTSWFGWSGGWVAASPNGAPTGTAVALNDGTNVTVTFTGSVAGSFVAGDVWQSFYISYPFLRVAIDASQMCEDCHSSRVQTSLYNESGGDGVKVFSHPVAEALAHGYDRTVGANGPILDANGASQAVGDGIATNDLKLDATNKVRCLTCHAVHNADSNSLTEDAR